MLSSTSNRSGRHRASGRDAAETQPQALSNSAILQGVKGLSEGWVVDLVSQTLSIRFERTGYQRLLQMANLAAWLASELGHHPEIRLGWGYCEIALTTHDASGLSERDLEYAGQLDRILQMKPRPATD